MQMKTQAERRTSALIMVTAKAAEGCSPCLDGYKRIAEESGASQQEIEFAIMAGQRVYTNAASGTIAMVNASADSPTVLPVDAKSKIIEGEIREQFLQEALAYEDVHLLDAYFRNRGYQPLETSRYVIEYQLEGRVCTEAYIPYTIDADHFSWVSYHRGELGIDLVGIIADMTQKDQVLARTLPAGDLLKESFIIQDGVVVAGHACDGGCLWNQWLDCCGVAGIGCLLSGPDWPFCVSVYCGICATWFCFRCGCC